MAAIKGNWIAPNSGVASWGVDWLHGPTRWSSPRKHLTEQLRYLRTNRGNHEAREFRNYLLWLGVYPVKKQS